MKKYSNISNNERGLLLEEFCEAISVLNGPEEIMNFITDLLTKEETVMIAKRIKIAKMLVEGIKYQEIQNSLKVSSGTISKINEWLLESGEGFKMVALRTKKKKVKIDNSEYSEIEKLKKRLPIAFWPELLIEDIAKTINKKQKDKIMQSVKKLDHKSNVYKQFNKVLR